MKSLFEIGMFSPIHVKFNSYQVWDKNARASEFKTEQSIAGRKERQVINISVSFLPKTLDPLSAFGFQDFLLVQSAFDTLVRINESGRIVAGLAVTWKIEDGGKTYRFKINEKARFHDGAPVTGQDVAKSLSSHFWPGSKSIIRTYLKDILIGTETVKTSEILPGIEVKENSEVTLRLANPYHPFLSVLAMPGFSVFKVENGIHIGSGAMKPTYDREFARWKFKRNESYYDFVPKVEQFCIQEISNLDEVKRKFKEGVLDVSFGAPPNELDTLSPSADFMVSRSKSLTVNHIYVNPRAPLMKELGFRRDLATLVRASFKKISEGRQSQTFWNHFLPKGILGPTYYLEEPEQRIEFRTVWSKKLRTQPRLKLVVLEQYVSDADASTVENSISAEGLDVDIIRIKPGQFEGVLASKDFDFVMAAYVGSFPDPDGFLGVLDAGTVFPENFKPSQDLMKAIARVRHLNDPADRLEKYIPILRAFEDQWYVIPLYQVNLPILYSPGVTLPESPFRFETDLRDLFFGLSKDFTSTIASTLEEGCTGDDPLHGSDRS